VEYRISQREKRLQKNLLYQLWRFVVLSLQFMKLTPSGG